ncbi:MAG TPA: rRNA maturation RNase YbeY [Vicinamibacterales bacterium]|nr:rRNA maturation RNase YbeY [Vicinamibacterales bacterium]
MAPRGLKVAVTDGRGRPLPSSALRRWLAAHAPARARGHLTIALVTDAAMRRMNAKYRRADYATDVLSFPSETPGVLGDIAIARGVAARQAKAQGHSESVEVKTLALHGLLHLLGYDHEHDRGEMRRVEDRLRKRAGLPVGLISRQTRSHRR